MKVFWFDTETTGVESERNGIIQLAYKVEIDGRFVDQGILNSNCEGKEITERALVVNGYTTDVIRTFPHPSEMYRNLLQVFERHVDKFNRNDKFVAGGYNVDFDVKFLRQLWKDMKDDYFGSWFAFGVIDPAQIIRFAQYCGFDFGTSAKLTDLAQYFGVLQEGAHDALVDIDMTLDVVRKLQERLGLRAVTSGRTPV